VAHCTSIVVGRSAAIEGLHLGLINIANVVRLPVVVPGDDLYIFWISELDVMLAVGPKGIPLQTPVLATEVREVGVKLG
jgi:hypothetical protein